MPTRIVEGQLPYTGGTGIEITTDKVINLLLREENNLILVNDDNEIYTDLQLAEGILPTDDFPVGVTVGRVLQSDGWLVSGTLLNFKTTSGDYGRWLYGNDGNMYYDHGTGTFTQIYSATEVNDLFTTLRGELATVAFTGDYNDLLNRPVIPQINDGTLTINQNNTLKGTFTANQSTSVSVDLTDTTYPAMTAGELGTGTDTTNRVVSAKVISDYVKGKIDTLMSLGKFLSLWDCVTGQPDSFPLATPYTYTTGDYFLVSTVSSANPAVNYKPDGSSYTTGQTSSVTESEDVQVGDIYIYDGSVWLLQLNHGKSIAFQEIAGDPYDNTNLALALNAKQGTLTAGTGISISSGTISNSKPYNGLTILSYGSSTWNDFLTAYNANSIVYCRASSAADPSSGSQTRLAFMAYVSDATTPTSVEFQYYRSRSSHSSAANQLDEVYVYKLSSTNGGTWTVEVRDTGAKLVAGTGIGVTVNSSGATISNNGVTSVNGSTGAVTVNDVKISSSAPASPIEGMVWYDITNDILKTYNGTSWDEAGGGGDVRVFEVPAVNDDISDMITRLSAGKGVILHEIVSGIDAFYKIDYHDDVTQEITASLLYSYNGGYARFYTIVYNYSTKKVSTKTSSLTYFFAPETAGTQGQILTKTASGYEWANASGGDVMVSSQSGNILTSGMKIWAGTQTDYDGLGTYDSNTVYLTI